MTIDLNELDPFGTVPTTINMEMASLLNFYVTSVVPKICHGQITEHKYNSWTIPQALQVRHPYLSIVCIHGRRDEVEVNSQLACDQNSREPSMRFKLHPHLGVSFHVPLQFTPC